MTRAVFRVDSGAGIGSGHLLRCLTLADELRRRGASTLFLCRARPGDLNQLIVPAGHALASLPELACGANEDDPHEQWSDVLQQQDAEATQAASANGAQADLLVVDHYGLGRRWEQSMRDAVGRLLVIDDLANRPHACNFLLDQNWHGEEANAAQRYAGLLGGEAAALLGPRFALLQPQYAALCDVVLRRGGAVQRLLVYFGAEDRGNETGKVVEALLHPQLAHLQADIVIGRHHPCQEAIRATAARRTGLHVHGTRASLADLMAAADLAIGASGSTTWERICLGLPTLVVTMAENQEQVARSLDGHCGFQWLARLGETEVGTYVSALLRRPHVTADWPPIVDGYGAKRVVETLLTSGVHELQLRIAEPGDALAYYDWRNDHDAVRMSLTSQPVTWPEHLDWFRRKLREADTRMFVAQANGLPIGQVRFDRRDRQCIISYSIDRLARGRGWGTWLVARALERMPLTGGDDRFCAMVKADNFPSRRVFARLGWRQTDAQGDVVVYSTQRVSPA